MCRRAAGAGRRTRTATRHRCQGRCPATQCEPREVSSYYALRGDTYDGDELVALALEKLNRVRDRLARGRRHRFVVKHDVRLRVRGRDLVVDAF
jgi:hypothetical protein